MTKFGRLEISGIDFKALLLKFKKVKVESATISPNAVSLFFDRLSLVMDLNCFTEPSTFSISFDGKLSCLAWAGLLSLQSRIIY